MKKAVFFDIDGTLWNEHMQVPESTTKAIRELRNAGNYAFLCSGRSRSNIRSEKILGIGFDGIVAACGTHIEYEGKKVCERLLTPEEAEELLRVIEAYHMEAVLEGPHYIYANVKILRKIRLFSICAVNWERMYGRSVGRRSMRSTN